MQLENEKTNLLGDIMNKDQKIKSLTDEARELRSVIDKLGVNKINYYYYLKV